MLNCFGDSVLGASYILTKVYPGLSMRFFIFFFFFHSREIKVWTAWEETMEHSSPGTTPSSVRSSSRDRQALPRCQTSTSGITMGTEKEQQAPRTYPAGVQSNPTQQAENRTPCTFQVGLASYPYTQPPIKSSLPIPAPFRTVPKPEPHFQVLGLGTYVN
jgi:hypothetical protein